MLGGCGHAKETGRNIALIDDFEHFLNSPFAHCVHVHTHCRDLATAVLVKFVATCLTSEAVKKKLVAKITVSQLEKGFPYLNRKKPQHLDYTLGIEETFKQKYIFMNPNIKWNINQASSLQVGPLLI